MNIYQESFNSSPLAQALIQWDGFFFEVNPAFCELLGYERHELMGRHYREVTPTDDSTYSSPVALQFEDQQTKKILIEKRYLHKEGHAIWVKLNVCLIVGDPKLMLIQALDLEGQKTLERNLNQRVEDVDQFAYIASHDLREPLVTMSGYASLVERRYGHLLDEKGQRYLKEITSGAAGLERKIDDLLAFSRAGRMRSEVTFHLSVALDEACKSLQGALQSHNASITLEHDESHITVGDQNMISNVLQNLISNALKYRRPDVKPYIEVKVHDADDFWKVSVQDNGIGFDMAHHDRIFVLFQRLHSKDVYPGTGIGLALCKKMVERHKGSIWAESIEGQGSTFYFTVPKKKA